MTTETLTFGECVACHGVLDTPVSGINYAGSAIARRITRRLCWVCNLLRNTVLKEAADA